MTSDSLKHTLDELHRLLEDERLDAQDADRLRQAIAEIQERLDADVEPMQPNATDVFEDFSTRFASEHPILSTGLRRLIDLLNQSGI